jgi:hypothetical protein
MFIESIILLIVGLTSVSIVGKGWENGMFGGSLGRTFAGGSIGFVSNKFLVQYTQFESLLRASFNGYLGLIGYFFIFAISALVLTWTNNIIKYRSLVV